jgi:hypothetical protein
MLLRALAPRRRRQTACRAAAARRPPRRRSQTRPRAAALQTSAPRRFPVDPSSWVHPFTGDPNRLRPPYLPNLPSPTTPAVSCYTSPPPLPGFRQGCSPRRQAPPLGDSCTDSTRPDGSLREFLARCIFVMSDASARTVSARKFECFSELSLNFALVNVRVCL